MSRDYREDIDAALTRLHPCSLLLVGAEADEIAARYLAACDACRVERLEVDRSAAGLLDTLLGIDRVELALVAGAVERLDKRTAALMLGRLRDLCAERLLLVVPMGVPVSGAREGWRVEELLAYGLYRAGAYTHAGRPLHVYSFDLYDYKPTPDWLNSRFWAHPELFDKFRW